MGTQVIAASTLTAGLRSDFADTYAKQKRTSDARLAPLMQVDVPSDQLTEYVGYFESAPHMGRWTRGKGIPSKAFASKQFTVTNKDWGHRVEWHRNDRMDDQTGTLFSMAKKAGESAATLDLRVAFQILTGAANSRLLESLPTAPDGAALFSTTDGSSAARFGATDGNLLTGGGVATGAAIRADLWAALEQARLYQDTEGEPLFGDEEIEAGVTVIYGAANEAVFREAFVQGRTLAAATTATSNAAVTNTILESGLPLTLWPTQRITDNDWIVVFHGAWLKPLFSTLREPMMEEFANMESGSDYSRESGVEYIQWHLRKGYGLNLPFGVLKINN